MFLEPTVFVLGAGASRHYGFPTGEEIVDEIVKHADALFQAVNLLKQTNDVLLLRYQLENPREDGPNSVGTPGALHLWNSLQSECHQLIKRVRTVNPLVIDYFLGHNPDLHSIGRLLIGAAIVSKSSSLPRPPTKWPDGSQSRNDWGRYIFYKLSENCVESSDLLRNQVRFVTFNYDTSLDDYLRASLASTNIFQRSDVDAFLGGDRITHVYGSIGPATEASPIPISLGNIMSHADYAATSKAYQHWNDVYERSRALRVIDPHSKPGDELELARRFVAEAAHIYILGYGFDHNNSKRVGLDGLKQPLQVPRRVSFTNFGDNAIINKRAGILFGGDERLFLAPGPVIAHREHGIFEKSTRNVYDALARDFDLR
jgi:hypothetical protein